MSADSDPTARALAVLSLLTSRAHWPGNELAERLGVTTRTVRRDVDRLRALGYQIDAAPGVDGGYRMHGSGGAATPPLFLDVDEAVAITTALLTAAGDQTAGLGDASVRALAKLHHVLPDAVRGQVDAVRQAAHALVLKHSPQVEPRQLTVLAEACRDRLAVRFDYRTRGDSVGERRVEPNSLVTVKQTWYLIAFDLGRDDWRLFRVDRISGNVERTGHGAAQRRLPHGDPLAFLNASLAETPYEHTAVVEVGCARAVVLDRMQFLSTHRVVDSGPDRCEVRLGAGDPGELARRIVELVTAVPVDRIATSPTVRTLLNQVTARLGGVAQL